MSPITTKEVEGGDSAATRVMIFSQYRDSVQEITACLHEHRPLVKVMEFVGQAGTKGESVGQTTKMNFQKKGSRNQKSSYNVC